MTWRCQNRGHAYSEGFKLENCNCFPQNNRLMSGNLINVIGTEILRSIPEIMDREFEKHGKKKNGPPPQKNRLRSGHLINIVGTEILSSVPEKMDLGQIEVTHISEGCNLETLAYRAMVTTKV